MKQIDRPELMENPDIPLEELKKSLRVIDRINWLFGTFTIIKQYCRKLFSEQNTLTILDVGAGSGYLGEVLKNEWGESVKYIRLDPAESIFTAIPPAHGLPVRARVPGLPFPENSVDLTVSTLVLHHLDASDRLAFLETTYRISTTAVVHHDLRRSYLGYLGAKLTLTLITNNRIAQHDGPLSVQRSNTAREWRELITGHELPYEVKKSWPWRVNLIAEKS